MPAMRKAIGSVDNETYIVEVKERDLVAGTAYAAPAITDLVAWDEAFYVQWEYFGIYEYFEVTVTEEGSEVFRGRTEEFDLQFSSHLVNDVQYSLTVKVVGGEVPQESNTTLFTLADKTPINYSIDNLTSDNISVSWDDLVTNYSYYKVYLKNVNLGVVIKEVIVNQPNITLGIPDPTISYETWVTSVSALNIFESDKSNIEVIVAPPTGLEYTLQGSDIQFNWDSSGVDGYNLYVKPLDGSFSKANDSLITTNSFLLSDSPNGSYEVYVTSILNGIESIPSSQVSYTSSSLIYLWSEQGKITHDVKGAILGVWSEQGGITFDTKDYISSSWIEQDEVSILVEGGPLVWSEQGQVTISTKEPVSVLWSEQNEVLVSFGEVYWIEEDQVAVESKLHILANWIEQDEITVNITTP